MKSSIGILFGLLFSSLVFAGQEGMRYEVVLTRGGQVITSPAFLGEFDKMARVEVGGLLAVEAIASTPDRDGNSLASMKIYLFENGQMQPIKEISVLASRGNAPSVQYSVPGTDALFTLKSTVVQLPE